MAKTTEAGAIPRLRFPEFRAVDSWIDTRLGDLFSERQETGYKSLPLLSVTEADGVVPQEQTNRRNVSATDKSRYLRVVPGDIAYNTMRMWEGRSARVSIEGVVSPAYTVCVPGAATDSHFFAYYFKTETLIGRFRQLSQGLVKDTLNLKYDAFSRIRASVPDVKEQRRIADCLKSLDDVIAAQAQKVEALKAHKRGLMQQLFPCEGETVPRLRFPEFRYSADWTVVPLGELLQGKPEYGVNAPAVPYSDGLPTYLRITDIDENGRFITEGKASVEFEVTDDDYLMEGDIVLARTGASVGKSYRYRPEDGRLVFAGFLIRIRPNQNRILPAFLSSFFTTRRYWDWIRLTSARSGQPGVNATEYAALPIPIPPRVDSPSELTEQERIGECLMAIDVQIAIAIDRLSRLRRHRQGLLQQLFPTIEGEA